MAWDPEVPGCFGHADKIFAIYPLDERQAFAWLTRLRQRGTTLADAEWQLRAYLASEGCGEEHIREQRHRLRTKFAPWLP